VTGDGFCYRLRALAWDSFTQVQNNKRSRKDNRCCTLALFDLADSHFSSLAVIIIVIIIPSHSLPILIILISSPSRVSNAGLEPVGGVLGDTPTKEKKNRIKSTGTATRKALADGSITKRWCDGEGCKKKKPGRSGGPHQAHCCCRDARGACTGDKSGKVSPKSANKQHTYRCGKYTLEAPSQLQR
jgi:hypothetical protein